MLWTVDLPFSVEWLLQSRGTSPPPCKGVAYDQEGAWPPSGGEVLCTGSFTSLPGLISFCQVTVVKLSNGLLVWREECSRITLQVSPAYLLSSRSPPACLPYLKLSTQYVCMCHLPLVQNAIPVTVQQTLLSGWASTSWFIALLLLLFGGRNGRFFQFGGEAVTLV